MLCVISPLINALDDWSVSCSQVYFPTYTKLLMGQLLCSFYSVKVLTCGGKGTVFDFGYHHSRSGYPLPPSCNMNETMFK